jgi:hypothetical protein
MREIKNLVSWFDNKNVALVGNALSLFDQSHGELIDSHDVVIRFNRGWVKTKQKTHGEKFDILVVNRYNTIKHNIKDGFPTKRIIHISPTAMISSHLKTYHSWEEDDVDIFFYPADYYYDLVKKVKFTEKKHKVSSGLAMLAYMPLLNPSKVSVFGFDWKKTPTFYDQRRQDPHVHDYQKEKRYCRINFLKNDLYNFY